MTTISKTTKDLRHHESIIEDGLKHFLHVGNALMAIRDGELYVEQYESFEVYCKNRWNISRPRAYQFIEAAEIALEMSTIVDTTKAKIAVFPTNEAQSRALASAADTPEERAEVWQAAVAAAPKNSVGEPVVTAKIVKAAAEELLGPAKPKEPKPLAEQAEENKTTGKPSHGTGFNPEEFDPKLNPELPPDEVDTTKPLAERIEEQRSIIERFARGLMKWFDDNLPKDPWLDDSRVDIARDQIKSAAASIRLCKAHEKHCPKCDGKGGKCKFCKGCGYLPKNSYQMAGGE